MKKWNILNKSKFKIQNSKFSDFIKALLENRGLKTKKDVEQFLNPKLEDVTIGSVGIDKKQLQKSIGRIKKAIENKERVIVFGDYDVDGICGSGILWETLNSLGAKAMPYIPHRIEEGYGLSIKGIQNVIMSSHPELDSGSRFRNKFGMTNKQVQHDKVGLIITVDNGIVANKAVQYAKKQGIDVIITDHHVPSKRLPDAYAIVHTTKLCGTGVAYILSSVILNLFQDLNKGKILNQAQPDQHDINKDSHLELVALATVADLVSLLGANRTLVKFGLEALRRTKRLGLLELFKEAGLDQSRIGIYEVGHIIAPRLNAMGRMEYAMDSLRLLCTKNKERAKVLAQLLGNTNRERQTLTIETVEHAKWKVESGKWKIQNLLFVSDVSYQQGVIGLVAGKLVEEFYKPAIVVSVGEKYSKASARSVNGFNIIEFIRGASELLVDAGGHPMAAGFTVETSKLSILQKVLEDKAHELLDKEKLTRILRIDCELDLSLISNNLYNEIQKLAPFGMGNPEPTFVSRKVEIRDIRVVGNEKKHLKLRVTQPNSQLSTFNFQLWDGIAFRMGERALEFHIGDKVDIAYTIDEDKWLAPRSSAKPNEVGNGNKKLQLKIKDIK